MYTKKKPLFLIIETPLHAGSGSDLGIVDLPIQRERHTGYPKIEASGIKGPLRDFFEKTLPNDKPIIEDVFGIEEGEKEGHASAVGFIDARMLFFPVKSVKGIFAYVTCPDILKRFFRDFGIFGFQIKDNSGKPIDVKELGENSICQGNRIAVKKNGNYSVLLEEYAFEGCTENTDLAAFASWCRSNLNFEQDYWAEKISKDLFVIDDDTFKDFINLYIEVIARTRIDNEKGNVVPGALWYEEYLPADTILYSCMMTANPFMKKDDRKPQIEDDDRIMSYLCSHFPKIIQLGGNATIGKGITRIVLFDGAEKQQDSTLEAANE